METMYRPRFGGIFGAIFNALASGAIQLSDQFSTPQVLQRGRFYAGYAIRNGGKKRRNMLMVSRRVKAKHRRSA